MNRLAIAIRLFAALLFLTGALPVGSAFAQGKSLKDQVIGTWSLVSFDSFNPAGKKVPSMEGGKLKGLLILTSNGIMSVQMIAEYPKLASHNRLKTTAAEEKAIAHGVLSFFGTYKVDEADKTLNLHIESSSFPNQVNGKVVKRLLTLTGDEMRFDNANRAAGGRNTVVWRRIK